MAPQHDGQRIGRWTRVHRHGIGRTSLRRVAPVAQHALLVMIAAVFMTPFYWMISSALKSNSQIFAQPLAWWPDPAQWHNFGDVLDGSSFPFLRDLGNSVFYAGSVTIGTVLSCAAVGYGFARLRFPGRDALFVLTLATMMIPQIVTFIPTYVLFRYLGLVGTYAPLIVPHVLGNAFFIFLLRQFFLRLPWDLSDAARIDGAGEWRIFWRIMLPLVRPALIVVAVLSGVGAWQDFFGPLVYLQDVSQYPLSVGLFAFQTQDTADWVRLMAASTLTTLPLILLFVIAQRSMGAGITLTGSKT